MLLNKMKLMLLTVAIIGCVAAGLFLPHAVAADGAAATAPAATGPAILPIPNITAQNDSLALLKRVFKDEYLGREPQQRVALAKMLLEQGKLDKTEPATRYVMLRQAADLAGNAGDAEVAAAAIDALAKTFAIDALDVKAGMLAQASAAATGTDQWEAIANTGLTLLDAAIRSERFALGQKIAQLSQTAAINSKQVDLVTAAQARIADFHAVMTAAANAQAGMSTIRKSPMDGPANLSVGIYTCFVRGDWKGGLLPLAQGSDAVLEALAAREIAGSQDPIKQLELADRWWDAGEGYKGWMQREIRSHAAMWYNTALKNLNGVTLARINKRISISGEAATEPSEKTVDLLSLIDPARDAVAGVWKMSAGVLASDDTQHARIAFPYEPPEEYDFRLEFARAQDKGNMAALLVEHGTPFGWAMGVQSNRVCRFESVNRHVHEGNPTEVKFPLQRDRKYILVIKVRKDGVQAIVDGKVIDEYKTDYKDMSRYALWKLPNERTLAIGTSEGAFLIYSAEVVEINGEGKGTR